MIFSDLMLIIYLDKSILQLATLARRMFLIKRANSFNEHFLSIWPKKSGILSSWRDYLISRKYWQNMHYCPKIMGVIFYGHITYSPADLIGNIVINAVSSLIITSLTIHNIFQLQSTPMYTCALSNGEDRCLWLKELAETRQRSAHTASTTGLVDTHCPSVMYLVDRKLQFISGKIATCY